MTIHPSDLRLTRRGFLAGATAASLAAAFPLPRAFAQPLSSAPLTVGALKVIPLNDGTFPLDLDIVPKAKSPAGAAILKKMNAPAEGPIPIPVNAFVVERAGKIVLIDAGTGAAGGDTLGKVAGALVNARIEPEKVEAVLLTHLHVDHAGGTITSDGSAYFPNAELVLQQKEIDFWMDDAMRSRAPQGMDGFFGAARKILAAYQGRVRAVNGEVELWPGLTAMPEPGHTPGHAGVLIADGKDSLLMWADIMHVAQMQFPHPDWSVLFDVDQKQAAETRAKTLDRLAADKMQVMGSHLADRGRIERDGKVYRMVPA